MGPNDRAKAAREDRARASQEAKKRRVSNRTQGTVADWASADGELLTKAVASIARHGGAIRLGYTRDGGAYAVGIYGDGDPFTEYIPPSENLSDYLRGLIEDYG